MEEQKFQNRMYETKRDKDVEMLKEEVKDLDCQLKDAQADRKELLIQLEETRTEKEQYEETMQSKLHALERQWKELT